MCFLLIVELAVCVQGQLEVDIFFFFAADPSAPKLNKLCTVSRSVRGGGA